MAPMNMRTGALILCFFLLVTPPAFAERFFCPTPIQLPASGANLKEVQAYLDNVTLIQKTYNRKTRKAQKSTLTDCLLGHLVTLTDNHSLLAPRTKAEASTLKLLMEEVTASMQTTLPFHRHKMQVAFVYYWLDEAENIGRD